MTAKKPAKAERDRPTVEQRRFGAAYHEAGHGVAAFLEGVEIRGLELMGEDGALIDGYDAGVTEFDGTIASTSDALRHIFICLAGEASVMACWALGMFPDAAIGATEAVGEDLIEHLLAAPAGASFAEASAYSGWLNTSESEDETNARAIADRVCHSEMEAARLIAWQRDRTIGIVQGERFLYLCQRLAGALLELGTITGEHATELLRRWYSIFTPTTEKEKTA